MYASKINTGLGPGSYNITKWGPERKQYRCVSARELITQCLQREAQTNSKLTRFALKRDDPTIRGPGCYGIQQRSYSQSGRIRGSSRNLFGEMALSSVGPGSYNVKSLDKPKAPKFKMVASQDLDEYKRVIQSDLMVAEAERALQPHKAIVDISKVHYPVEREALRQIEHKQFPAPWEYRVGIDRNGRPLLPSIRDSVKRAK